MWTVPMTDMPDLLCQCQTIYSAVASDSVFFFPLVPSGATIQAHVGLFNQVIKSCALQLPTLEVIKTCLTFSNSREERKSLTSRLNSCWKQDGNL